MKKYDFYLASGWFNEQQEFARKDILEALNEVGAKYFSPKDEIVCPMNANEEMKKNVYNGNVLAIKESFFMVASTVGKDMGTIHETGVASILEIPIIYYCPGLKGPFNLMLAETAVAVATDIQTLKKHIKEIMENKFYKEKYTGDIE